MKRGPTHRQGQLLAYVYWYTKIHRVPPSENEIAEFMGIYGPSVHRMILLLEVKGYLSRRPGEPRTLRVLLPPEQVPNID
jgi:DNA-binding MarR family transcriptional regulator